MVTKESDSKKYSSEAFQLSEAFNGFTQSKDDQEEPFWHLNATNRQPHRYTEKQRRRPRNFHSKGRNKSTKSNPNRYDTSNGTNRQPARYKENTRRRIQLRENVEPTKSNRNSAVAQKLGTTKAKPKEEQKEKKLGKRENSIQWKERKREWKREREREKENKSRPTTSAAAAAGRPKKGAGHQAADRPAPPVVAGAVSSRHLRSRNPRDSSTTLQRHGIINRLHFSLPLSLSLSLFLSFRYFPYEFRIDPRRVSKKSHPNLGSISFNLLKKNKQKNKHPR